ncbi:rta1 domain-containing protein [Colletotrichum kahawae]|uniref:Rta1 domain-containing protein n=1 Tax=Colletotrichum kahawae TaxID=34407 RepID=A0AAD9YIC3_COLKA|nr:rta1 domain-containing protein [Colletotrichum kahawae]
MASSTQDPGEFVFYHYDPSLPAACIFIALFGISFVLYVFQMIKFRSWYFVPFLIGCCFEIVGYIGRALSAIETPDWTTTSYTIQSLTLLLGPALLAASIYMVLGRLIRFLEAEHLALIRTKWLTKIFVLGDVISFVTQGAGSLLPLFETTRGAILSRAKSLSDVDLGENIIIAGLAVQIAFFGVFIIVICLFHYRINRSPTGPCNSVTLRWRPFIWILYGASILIMVRSVFRVTEYVTGSNGVLIASEVYIYVFDAALMFLATAMFNLFHPGRIIRMDHKLTAISETSITVGLSASV